MQNKFLMQSVFSSWIFYLAPKQKGLNLIDFKLVANQKIIFRIFKIYQKNTIPFGPLFYAEVFYEKLRYYLLVFDAVDLRPVVKPLLFYLGEFQEELLD